MIGVQLVLNLGIIGYRKHAAKLISYIEERSDSKINFIYHPIKTLQDSRCTNNFSDLYHCDAVLISSPNDTHFQYMEKLIHNFSGYIFCEKPPITNFDELEKLKNFSNKQKKKIFFDFMFRFSELNEIIKKETNSEHLGKFIHIDIIMSKGLAFKQEYLDSWRADGKNNLHNILDANAIHYIDLINLHLGKIKKIYYIPSLVSKKGTSFDTSYIIIEYENNITLSVFNSYATPLINEISIIGTNGHLTIRNNKLEIYSPRDSFDKDGLFSNPQKICSVDFNLSNDVENSLKKSLDFFISRVKMQEDIPIKYFDTSTDTNKIILQLKDMKISIK